MSKKIMLVDDVPIANFIMKKMIQKVAPHYQITDFESPDKAITSLEQLNPDLIFLDLNMPSINGWRFLELMDEHKLENKVYILTSSTSELDVQQSKQYKNVSGFLIKPLTIKNLPDILKVID